MGPEVQMHAELTGPHCWSCALCVADLLGDRSSRLACRVGGGLAKGRQRATEIIRDSCHGNHGDAVTVDLDSLRGQKQDSLNRLSAGAVSLVKR